MSLACGKQCGLLEVQLQASTSKCDPSPWPGDDRELLAASQAVEDTIKQPEPPVRPKQPEPPVRPKQPEPPVRPKQPEPPGQLTESPSTAQDHEGQPFPTESPLSDSPVELEGWVRLWENPNGIPSADISWLKNHNERGLFTPVQIYKDNTGVFRRRQVMKSDCMWFYPEGPPGHVRGAPPTPQLFFRSRVCVASCWSVEVLPEVTLR
ncbi:uncharacterized protein LOC105008188 [Esox lucius]|uniref:uncharacterized protein LOC105008188 n=1 Tax=Esox lucius TaxID=8010 RepID=UPI001476F185|nr:uncharacterized protein LOC105008188 [Esox lucius]